MASIHKQYDVCSNLETHDFDAHIPPNPSHKQSKILWEQPPGPTCTCTNSHINKKLWPFPSHHQHPPPINNLSTTMLPHRRREFPVTGGNQFTFSNPIQKPNSTDPSYSDGMEYDTWAERIKGKYSSFGKPNDLKFGAWTRRMPRNNYSDRGDEDEFRWLAKSEEEDSDVQSPPLWKKPGSPTIQSAGSSPIRSQACYDDRDSHISNGSRAQTIARYRQEMLDLVRDMPENAYELSLRDIVESPRITMTKPLQENTEHKLEDVKEEKSKKKVKKDRRRISRSESMDTGGFLLKMFMPGISTRKKSLASSGTCTKVAPKPLLVDGEKGGVDKSRDVEWWSNDFEGMSSSNNSSSSSDSSISRRSRKMSGCYSFFRKSKSTGN